MGRRAAPFTVSARGGARLLLAAQGCLPRECRDEQQHRRRGARGFSEKLRNYEIRIAVGFGSNHLHGTDAPLRTRQNVRMMIVI